MILVLRQNATEAQRDEILERVESLGLKPHLSVGEERTIIGVVGDEREIDPAPFAAMAAVERVVPILRPFKLASRDFRDGPSKVVVGSAPADQVEIGGTEIVLVAGPCAVEHREQIQTSADAVKKAGARILRGGAFKPRTSPYSFQGLGAKGLELLAECREATGLPVATEVMTPADVELVAAQADLLQIGARNMQNYHLLREVGMVDKPVLLKRGPSATLEELCLAAEYVMSQGNQRVILCERGIRTFETATRNTLDLSAVPVLKEWSHLPVMVDPSHGTGKRGLITPMALAAVAAGADALMVEAHPNPAEAKSDGPQALTFEMLTALVEQARGVASAIGRSLAP